MRRTDSLAFRSRWPRRGGAGKASRKQNFIDNMNETLASLDVSSDDAGHIVTRVASSLLEDTVGTVVAEADSATLLSICHLNGSGTDKVILGNNSRDNVEKKDVGKSWDILKDGIEKLLAKL